MTDLAWWWSQAPPFIPDVTDMVGTTAPVWAPTVEDIAIVVPAYTAGGFDDDAENAGALQGAFTDATEPTEAEVETLIFFACREVEGRVGLPIQEKDYNLARAAATWHTAMNISSGKQPAATDDATGEYRGYSNNFIAAMRELVYHGRMPLNTRMR